MNETLKHIPTQYRSDRLPTLTLYIAAILIFICSATLRDELSVYVSSLLSNPMSAGSALAYGFVGQILGSVFYGECNFLKSSYGLRDQIQEFTSACSS
jgi:hypothetical protein